MHSAMLYRGISDAWVVAAAADDDGADGAVVARQWAKSSWLRADKHETPKFSYYYSNERNVNVYHWISIGKWNSPALHSN